MRAKKIFSFDEEKDAEKIIQATGTLNYSDIYLVAKYFRQKFGYGEIRLEKELIKFCKSRDENFNPVVEAEQIKKWIKSAMTYGLRKIDYVTISQKEINFLKTIEAPKERRLMFATLIMAKALKKRSTKSDSKNLKTSDNYYIHYSNFLDIIRIAKVTNFSELDLAGLFGKYKEQFSFYSPEKELIRIEFIDKEPEAEIRINNPESCSDYYDTFFGEQKIVALCENCKKQFIKRANNQKLCDNCAKEKRRIYQRDLMRKRNEKS